MARNQQRSQKQSGPRTFPVLPPTLQVAFAARLDEIRNQYLDEALRSTVDNENVDITVLDAELAKYVGSERLKAIGKFGIRGEVFFPVPYLLHANPYLLGYYRLLYGFSQKQFYLSGTPFLSFKHLEAGGIIRPNVASDLIGLCQSLIETGWVLVQGLGKPSLALVHDLQLLTAGPQLRGSRNTELGKNAEQVVFNHVKSLIEPRYIQSEQEKSLTLVNDAGMIVTV